MVNGKKKLTKHTEQVNEVSQAEFSRIKRVSKAMVTKWKQENRLVFTPDGKRILVNESNQRLKETSSPAGYVNSIHAAERRKSHDEQAQEIPFTELKDRVNELQLDLNTQNADELFRNSRALKEKAQALAASLEYDLAMGKLVIRDDVHKAAFEASRMLRDKLQGLPQQTAPNLHGKTVIEMQHILSDEINLLLTQFCDDLEAKNLI